MVQCFAPDCNHQSESHNCSFFGFPSKEKKLDEYRRWIRLLRLIRVLFKYLFCSWDISEKKSTLTQSIAVVESPSLSWNFLSLYKSYRFWGILYWTPTLKSLSLKRRTKIWHNDRHQFWQLLVRLLMLNAHPVVLLYWQADRELPC